MFDVKEVFQQEYPQTFRKHPVLAYLGVQLLRRVWRQKIFQNYVVAHPSLKRVELMGAILKDLNIQVSFRQSQKQKIPQVGSLIIVCNHSMGVVDGMALLSEVYKVRPDVKIMQGRVLRHAFGLGEHSMEVDNLAGGIDRKVYKSVKMHLSNGGVILMFPAGEVARSDAGEIQEGAWNAGFYRFAKATGTAILPMFIKGGNSRFFYALGKISKPLSMLWVMPELFLHRNENLSICVSEVLSGTYISDQLAAGESEEAIIAAIRDKSLALSASA